MENAQTSSLAAVSERKQSCREAIPRRHDNAAADSVALTANRSTVRVVHWLAIDLVGHGSISLGVLRPGSAEGTDKCVHPRHCEREIHAVKSGLTASAD